MAKIEINTNTGRPVGVSRTESGRYRGMITTPDRGTITGPTVDDQVLAKRHAEVIRALIGTGTPTTQIKNIVKGITS